MTTVQRREDLPSVRRDLRVPEAVCVYVRSSGINLIYDHSPEKYPTVYKHWAINENEKRKAHLEADCAAQVRMYAKVSPSIQQWAAVQCRKKNSKVPLRKRVSLRLCMCVYARNMLIETNRI